VLRCALVVLSWRRSRLRVRGRSLGDLELYVKTTYGLRHRIFSFTHERPVTLQRSRGKFVVAAVTGSLRGGLHSPYSTDQ